MPPNIGLRLRGRQSLGTGGKLAPFLSIMQDEGDEMEVCEGLSAAFVVFDEFRKRLAQAMDRSTTHRLASKHETGAWPPAV